MQKYFDAVLRSDGRPAVGATIAVTVTSTGLPATLYSDNGVTVIPGSTLTADASGEYNFYAQNGLYTLTTSYRGYVTEAKTNVTLFDPKDSIAPSVKDFGSVGDGVTDDTAAFNSASSQSFPWSIPAGAYKFASNVVVPVKDSTITSAPGVTFTTGLLDQSNIITSIGASPIFGFFTQYRTAGSAYNGYGNIAGISSVLIGNTSSAATVALYGNGVVNATGNRSWGINAGCYVLAAGTGIAAEFDSNNNFAGGLAYGVSINAVGTQTSEAAIVISNNSAAVNFKYGISFNNANGGVAIGNSAIYMNVGSVPYFINVNGTFTSAELNLPSFVVGATTPSVNSILRVLGSASGTPTMAAIGGATNATINLQGKGTGGVSLLAGDTTSKVQVNTTGLGFFGTTPAAQGTGYGTPTSIAKTASLPGTGATLAQVGGTLAALIADLKANGLIGA